MKKVMSVVGARPQFIKLAATSLEIRKIFNEVIVHTGQHYDFKMSSSFFNELNIPEPDYNLEIGSDTACKQIAQIILKLEGIVAKENPDIMIVFGDTNSTAAASIVAAKMNIKLVHVEAGLREFNKQVPEETNKLITDILSDYYFSPTQTGVINLKQMGITRNVYNIGDVTIDLIKRLEEKIESNYQLLEKFNVERSKYYYITCHRAANTDNKERLTEILSIFSEIDLPFIFPIHPRTRKMIKEFNLEYLLSKNVICIDPIGFIDSQTFIKNAKASITDSGGVIKETYYHKVPGIIIDTQSEWIETIEEGWNHLIGPHKTKIINKLNNLKKPALHSNCIGNGTASEIMVKLLKNIN
jgi:UDP-N-acetylglucosamine 2-epimerase